VDVDVSCEWLGFFMEDDERLAQIRRDYKSGAMLTGEVKKELIEILQVMVKEHQEKRLLVTPEVIASYMQVRPLDF
jgi:tryptophanyl-tRNA synthetase